jgi:hypothetical protein
MRSAGHNSVSAQRTRLCGNWGESGDLHYRELDNSVSVQGTSLHCGGIINSPFDGYLSEGPWGQFK